MSRPTGGARCGLRRTIIIGVNSATTGHLQRRELVRRRVLDEGYARVEDLMAAFGVSLMTIHRDLDALESAGWITKIRGAATANPAALVDAAVPQRRATMQREKIAIAAAAAALLQPGQTVFVDDSTTGLALVPHLAKNAPLTVATNFVPLITALGGIEGVDPHLVGGQYNSRQESCQGIQTADALDTFTADIAFLSPTALTAGKILHRSEPTILVRRALMRNARRRVLLVDHAKFGRLAPHVLCDIAEFEVVVTDAGADAEDLALLRERCADVRVGALPEAAQ